MSIIRNICDRKNNDNQHAEREDVEPNLDSVTDAKQENEVSEGKINAEHEEDTEFKEKK